MLTAKSEGRFGGRGAALRAVAVSPDGRRVLTGGRDHNVRLWDLESKKELACFTGHTGEVQGVAFSPDGRRAASGSADYTVRVWRLPNVEPPPKPAAPVKPPAAGASNDGFVSLFNGKDLTGWKTHTDQPGDWKVEDGLLVGSGPLSHLFSERGDYRDFHLRLVAKINRTGDSGLYFRSEFGASKVSAVSGLKYPSGYEAQIVGPSSGDDQPTGSLCGGFSGPGARPTNPADTWFTLEVIANGDHLVIRVDNKVIEDVHDKSNSYGRGHLALQCGGGGRSTRIQVRKIEIMDLTTASANVGASAPSAIPAGSPTPLPSGSVWKGTRTYRKGAWIGVTVPYELHIRERSGQSFNGHIFNNGPGRNRAEVEGELSGDSIRWHERQRGSTAEYDMQGALKGDTIRVDFKGGYDARQNIEGDGELQRLTGGAPVRID